MKTTLRLAFLLAAASFTFSGAIAQYNFTTFTAPYAELGKSIEIESGNIWDDPEFVLNFGFSFSIGGEEFTQARQMGLGAMLEFQSLNTIHQLGYFSDLMDGEEIGAPSFISFSTEGTPGNLICKLQYTDCAFYNEVFGDEPTSESRVNFQIWLYQADNSIEFRFGENTITANSEVHDGLPGPLIGLVIGVDYLEETFDFSITLKGNPMNPEIENPTFNDFPEHLTGDPEDGRVYRFAPGVVSTKEAANPSFSIYPTIAEQILNISGDFMANSTYQILSIDGRLVQAGQLESNILELNELARGTYVLHLEGSPKAAKFIKK